MALLRSSVKLWSRGFRLFSTEILHKATDEVAQVMKHGYALSVAALKNGDFKLNKWLEDEKSPKLDNWTDIRKDFLSSREYKITEATVDMLIVNLCLDSQRTNLALAYLEFLWDSKKEMGLSSMTAYLKICYTDSSNFDERRKKYLIDIYETVRKKYPVVDAFTGECCILGILLTDRWKESFEILDIIKFSSKPKASVYSTIIIAAFANNEPEIGWKYFKEVFENCQPHHNTYVAYLEYCQRNFTGSELEKAIGKMFKFWGSNDVNPYKDVISAYTEVLKNLGWHAEETSIRDTGICRSCSHRLYNLHISKKEYAQLANMVRDRVIVGDDIYTKTTPKELENFLTFVQRMKPWDIVIDGLNISYLAKHAGKSNSFSLVCVIKKCVDLRKKILVLGRKHMLKWPKHDILYMNQHAHVFLAENRSQDDPYLLYATLTSGPETMFVSRDLMRQHKFLLKDPEMFRIYKYWQMSHQLMPHGVLIKNGVVDVKLINPPMYLPVVQNDSNGWHVPFTFDPSHMPSVIFEPSKSWMCFRKKR